MFLVGEGGGGGRLIPNAHYEKPEYIEPINTMYSDVLNLGYNDDLNQNFLVSPATF